MIAALAVLPAIDDSLTEIISLHGEINGLGHTSLEKAIRIGELLVPIKSRLKHGQWLPWIKSNLPFSDETARNYLMVFNRKDEIPKSLEFGLWDAYKLFSDASDAKPHVSHNSGDNEWFTPPDIIWFATQVLGRIDLDPASSKAANQTVGARRFFSKRDDGLSHKWAGNVWMNPPYQSDLIGQFTAKLSQEYHFGRVKQAIALVNNATETEWFSNLARSASGLCFPNHRVRFWHPAKKTCAPLQGQCLLYLGTNPDRFFEHFASLGLLCDVQTI